MRTPANAFRVLAILGALALSCEAAKPLPAVNPEPQKNTPAASSSAHEQVPQTCHFAIATENESATKAAEAILRSGGHAVDAAISAAFVLGVVNPTASGVGGGGFALVWDEKTKQVRAFDFRESAPEGIEPRSLDERPVQESRRGVMVGVPGEIAGLHKIHQLWGKKTFAEDLEPAITFAQNGFPLSPHMERAISNHSVALSRIPELRETLLPKGSPLKAGEIAKNLRLAATLREVSQNGPLAFYQGPIAKDMILAARSLGSPISEKDFANYAVIERTPLHATYDGLELYTMPPPSAGGILFLQTLGMHSPESLRSLGLRSGSYVHLLAESFRASFSDRIRSIGDPAFVPDPSAKLLDPGHLAKIHDRIKSSITTEIHGWPIQEAGTSHLVIVDCEGNVVSLTTTINDPFGARIVGTQSGVLLNNELDDFTAPSVLRHFKTLQESPNRPRSLARPVSSMTPVIGLRGAHASIALGGSGGVRIAQNVTQTFLGAIVFGEGVDTVQAPRFSVDIATSRLVGEPELLTEDFLRHAQLVGEKPTTSNYPAAVQLIQLSADSIGPHHAASDPRKFGYHMLGSMKISQ